VRSVLESQVAELEESAALYRSLDEPEEAEDLARQVAVLHGHLAGDLAP
jgi:hypothetical protein